MAAVEIKQRRVLAALVLLAAAGTSCGRANISVVFAPDGHGFSSQERWLIQQTARTTAREARRYLTMLPPRLTLRVEAGPRVMSAGGEAGSALPPELVIWTVDVTRPGGAAGIASTRLRRTLLYEFCVLARVAAVGAARSSLDEAIAQGLAEAFVRDLGAVTPTAPRSAGLLIVDRARLRTAQPLTALMRLPSVEIVRMAGDPS